MAHNINTYVGRQAAWHKLGMVTDRYLTSEELLLHAGLDYTPEKRQLEWAGVPVEAWGVFRPDNDAFLGPVGKDYTIVNHAEGFKMTDSLIASRDGAHYETAGCLGKGEVVWGLADLNMSFEVGKSGDKSESYLLFTTSYDGSHAHQYRITSTRVVCQNTLNVALSAKSASQFRVKHTKNAQARINDAHAALESIGADVQTVADKLNYLSTRRITKEGLVDIMDRLFPAQKDDKGEKRDTPKRNQILADVLERFEYNDGNQFPEFRGTAYNLLNGVTEYADHFRSTRGTDRVESAMFGSGDKLKTQAMEVIMMAANGMPVVETRQVFTPAVSALDLILAEGSLAR